LDRNDARAARDPEEEVILIDAGPLVALVDGSDQHHHECVGTLREIREPLATVWPAVTESLYLLLESPRGQDAVLEMLERGAVRVLPLTRDDVPRIRELMGKYRDQPMDLADAALVRVAEREGLDRVFTVDRRDFEVYRIGRRKPFRILPKERAPGRGAASRSRGRRRPGRRR
jgi:predicted nucleic acid-binding protein